MMKPLALALLLACCGPAPAPRPPGDAGFVVMGARVFDGERFLEANVHVTGATIAGFVDAPPPGARVIDGKGHTLLPGLIDAHTHIGTTVDHLTRFHAFGVTTVIDQFGPPELIGKLHELPAGRASLFGAGNLATAPGGHGTEYGIPIPTITRPEEAPAFVAARKKEGSDFLKIVFDRSAKDPMPTLSIETVRALARAGHAAGLVVVVHTGGCDDIRAALDTEADVIAHGCALEEGDDLPARLAATKKYFNPTLAVQLRPCGMEYWIPLVADHRFTAEERERLGKDRHDHDAACSGGRLRLVGEAAKRGVRLLAGPDSPNRRIPVGASLLAEIDLLRQAGASIEQSLAAATKNPAEAFRLDDRGRIAPGKRADLLLVAGDASQSIRALWQTRKIWKAGRL